MNLLDISKLIEDSDRLFLVSGMVDGQRDALRDSIESSQGRVTEFNAFSTPAPSDQRDYFFQLKSKVESTLTSDGVGALQELFFKDRQESLSLASLYQHYVALSRFCDLAHQAPRFILSERANEQMMAAMDRKLDSNDPEAAIAALAQGEVTLDLSESDDTDSHSTGLYL